MKITIENRESARLDPLRDRLDEATKLECVTHGKSIEAVSINVFENGWFDSRWTTCCEDLEQQAVAVVKARF
jgi:hypothetical protein